MYVSEPVYSKYLALSGDYILVEDQPLPAAASPAALSPGYVVDSDLKKDLEESPIYYATDVDDDEDKEEESSEDDDDEEEEHLAPADSTVVTSLAICWEIDCKRLNTDSITVKSGSISYFVDTVDANIRASKRRTMATIEITILKTNTPYPSRKIRRIRACTHQRPLMNKDQYAVSRGLNTQYSRYRINIIFWKISSVVPTPRNPQYAVSNSWIRRAELEGDVDDDDACYDYAPTALEGDGDDDDADFDYALAA
ncbi:hypothetical protein Tco_1429466 [Tanacetum coccineum]